MVTHPYVLFTLKKHAESVGWNPHFARCYNGLTRHGIKNSDVCGDTDCFYRICVVSNGRTKTSVTEIHILPHARYPISDGDISYVIWT